MKNKRIELFLYSKSISFIITFIILLSCCRLSNFPTLEYMTNMITLLFALVLILFYLLKCEISKLSLSLIIYMALLCISSLLGEKSSIVLLLKNYYRIIALAFYLDYGLKYYPKNIVGSLYLSYSILVLINFYMIRIYPNRLKYDEEIFFGHKNNHILRYIPTLMFMFLNKYFMKRKLYIIEYILIIIITYCIFYCFSATSVFAYTILVGYFLLEEYINKKEIFNSKTYFLTYIITFMGIIVLKVQKLFSFIIIKLLGKDLTFTGRTLIWDNVSCFIKQRFFIGYGREENSLIASKLGNKAFTHAHNTILDVLYKGGIVSLIMFFIILILPVKELYKYRKNRLTKLMAVILFSFFIMMNFEARQESMGLYMVLISCYNISYILKANNEINKEQEK